MRKGYMELYVEEKRLQGKGTLGCVFCKECEYHSAAKGGLSVVSEQLKFHLCRFQKDNSRISVEGGQDLC